jgi:hypothetical protein
MKLAFEERNCIHYKDNKLNNIELSDVTYLASSPYIINSEHPIVILPYLRFCPCNHQESQYGYFIIWCGETYSILAFMVTHFNNDYLYL